MSEKGTYLFLINDADPLLARVIKNKFQKQAGWDADITNSVEEAVKLCMDKKPDSIMTEIILNDSTGKTGFDFIEAVRKKGYDHDVVVFTELRQEEDKKKAEEMGVKHYFVKSEISINDLMDELAEIVKK